MSSVQGVNLLSPSRRIARLRRRRIACWSSGLVIYAAALVVISVGIHISGSGADRSVAADLAAVRTQLQDAEQAIHELRPKLFEARNVLAANRAVGNQPDWSLLLSLLSGLLDERTVLTSCRIEPITGEPWQVRGAQQADAQQAARGPYRVHVEGFGRSHAAVQSYVMRLERARLFEEVTLLNTRTAMFQGDEAIRFRIQCHLGAPPAQDDSPQVLEESSEASGADDQAVVPLALPDGDALP